MQVIQRDQGGGLPDDRIDDISQLSPIGEAVPAFVADDDAPEGFCPSGAGIKSFDAHVLYCTTTCSDFSMKSRFEPALWAAWHVSAAGVASCGDASAGG